MIFIVIFIRWKAYQHKIENSFNLKAQWPIDKIVNFDNWRIFLRMIKILKKGGK